MDTTELPVCIRKNIYSSSLDFFFFLKKVSASVSKRLNYSSREEKKNCKFPNVAINLEVSSDVWVMTDEALKCKSRTAGPIYESDVRPLNFSACKNRC